MTKTTLYDYTDVEPLEVRETVPVNTNGSILGWAGPSNRKANVVVSQRHRHKYDGGKQDYYRKYESYNYGENTLKLMEQMGATRIAVHEVDNERILEFNLNQFWESDLIAGTFEIGGKNRCVPVDDAIYSWDRDDCTIVKDHQ